MSLFSMIAALEKADVRFVLIGGMAAIAHGLPYATNDVDICYDTAPDNLEALATLLASWNAYLRGAEEGLPFIMDARTLRTSPFLTLRTREGDIDLLDRVPGVGDYSACAAVSVWSTLGEINVRLLSLDSLIDSKKAANRPKDIEHVIALETMREARRRQEE